MLCVMTGGAGVVAVGLTQGADRGFAVSDMQRVMTGERVWWLWDGPAIADVGEGLLLLEEDKVLNPLSRKNQTAEQSGEQPPRVL